MCLRTRSRAWIYSSSPEYPATCCRDEWRDEPRRSSLERRRVGYAVISLDNPQLAAGSFIRPIQTWQPIICTNVCTYQVFNCELHLDCRKPSYDTTLRHDKWDMLRIRQSSTGCPCVIEDGEGHQLREAPGCGKALFGVEKDNIAFEN